MHLRRSVAVLGTVALALAGCGDDAREATVMGPTESFCGDLTGAAFPPNPQVVDWFVTGLVDEAEASASCVLTGARHRVEVVVHVGAKATGRYDAWSAELDGGGAGYGGAAVTRPDGWWSRGQRYVVARRRPVRVAHVVHGETGGMEVVARIGVVEITHERGVDLETRTDDALDVADALVTSVPVALDAG